MIRASEHQETEANLYLAQFYDKGVNESLFVFWIVWNFLLDLSILENTYTLARVTPFVGNKRKEITSNPIFYFIDNGFRNQSLRNLSTSLDMRQDAGLLFQSAIFQELLKFKVQNFYDITIHFWRTQSGAEVDFVLYKDADCIIPIEAKYKPMNHAVVSRGFRSFIEAYKPKYAFFITKDFNKKIVIDHCEVFFISFSQLMMLFNALKTILNGAWFKGCWFRVCAH